MTVDVQRFQGGQGWIARAGAIGALGLAASLAGLFIDPKVSFFGYLVGFCYWAGIAFAAVILQMIFHAFHAKWMVVFRRALETMGATLPIFILLFIPIGALGMQHLYPWVHPDHDAFTHHELELLHHKEGYLNVPFFLVRTAIYFVIAIFLAERLYGLSRRQDESGDPALTVAKRRLSAGGLPFIAIAISFAAFDWIMTLNPLWFSTIFGVYYFAGSFLSTLCILVLLVNLARGRNLFGNYVTPEHTHNLGKLMLGFTAFWAYIAFSQFMLIWIADLPEETPFFKTRMEGSWAVVGVILIICHFLLPFFTLLSKNLKRKPAKLALVACWLLAIHFVDLYWLIVPTLDKTGPVFHWSFITAFLGIGGLAIAFGVWRSRGKFALPVRDPFLADSLKYRQP